MAELPSKFREFLASIRPTEGQINEYVDGHENLRERLTIDDELSEIHVADFLQGSYARRTAVRPIGDEKSDVDVVFVTNLPKSEYTPDQAMGLCEPFLDEYYPGRWTPNQRSYKIELSEVEIDLVLTAAPSEAVMHELTAENAIGRVDVASMANQQDMGIIANSIDATFKGGDQDWQDEPLDIPDRKLNDWDQTHPLATLDWTQNKNDRTSGHYINVIKAIKWWRRVQVETPERPKSYPLERLVAECCPNDITSVAEGVTRTLNVFVEEYAKNAQLGITPTLGQHGIPEKDVLERVEGQDFAAFYDHVTNAAELANRAFDEQDKEDAAMAWRRLFGEKFPLIGGDGDGLTEVAATSFTPPSETARPSSQRFG